MQSNFPFKKNLKTNPSDLLLPFSNRQSRPSIQLHNNPKMGCTSSKAEYRHINLSHQNPSIPDLPLQNHIKSEESDIQVINSGQAVPKSRLDDLTDNNINSSNRSNPSNPSKALHQCPSPSLNQKPSELSSKTLPQSSQNFTQSLQSKTEKLEFANHPHEFDFSFINERLESRQDDITDQIYNEIKEMS